MAEVAASARSPSPTPSPSAGDHNSEMGCAGRLAARTATRRSSRSDADGPDLEGHLHAACRADYAYKAAINKTWDENYGAGGRPGGDNIAYTAPADGAVTFYYDHATHWVTSDAQGPIITAPGSFQSELGCPADWSPDCMKPWLQDPDGDGTYTWSTDQIPAGTYEFKVAHGLCWDENYGAGGAPGGANVALSVPADGLIVTISYVLATHAITTTVDQGRARPPT